MLAKPGLRCRALDGLRGVAALFVVFYHIPWTTHVSGALMVRNAYLWVDFFFILSGFVIAANYARGITDGLACRAFLVMRFFRLYPLHVAVLAALVALEAIKLAAQGVIVSDVVPFTGPNSPRLLVENLFMLQGLGLEHRLGWNPPGWSIGAEFVAYVLFGLLAMVGALRRKRFIVVLAALALTTDFTIAAVEKTLDATYALGLLRCLAGFSLGVAIEFFSARADGARRAARWSSAVLLLVFGVLACVQGAATFVVIPLFVAVVATMQFDRGLVARLLTTRPAQFLGRASYSIYMIHAPLLAIATIVLKRALHLPTLWRRRGASAATSIAFCGGCRLRRRSGRPFGAFVGRFCADRGTGAPVWPQARRLAGQTRRSGAPCLGEGRERLTATGERLTQK